VLERPLRILAIVLSLLLVASFTVFAVDDFGRASAQSQDRITGVEAADPTPAAERARERRDARGREVIDDAN
jgi:hypothetical protein